MKTWTIKVELDQSMTVVPIHARCVHTAIALLSREIAGKFVADKRYAEGKITISDPEGKEVYIIPQEGTGEPFFVKDKEEGKE